MSAVPDEHTWYEPAPGPAPAETAHSTDEPCDSGVVIPIRRRVEAPDDVQALVERAQAADADAWEALYRRVYPKLLAYASRRLDHDQAKDAVSETMARAVARIDRFAPRGGGFDAWLYGICRHVVLDTQRANGRRGYGPPPDQPQPDADPLDGIMRHEEATAVRAAFARLSDDDRELLELRVVAGLSSDDAAAVLNKRPGAVRMAQSRALERLRRHLDEVQPDAA